MGLSRVFERLYVKVYVGIIVSKTKIEVLIVTCHGEKCKKNRLEFEASTTASGLHDFIADATAETPFYYISVLNNSVNQGAIALCENKGAMDFYDISLSKTICVNNSYMLYSSKYDLDKIKSSFKSFGVDFIFSPFTLLTHIFKEKIDSKAQLYVLIQEDNLTMAVMQKGTLLYGAYDQIENSASSADFDDKESEAEEEIVFDLEEDDDAVSIDDLDALDELTDLDDLEDLDSIDDLDDFSDETLEIGEESVEEDSVDDDEVPEDFGEDYHRYKMISKRLQEYYEDSRYDNEFVESVYIAECSESSEDLKRYLEEELFLSVVVRHVELNDFLVDISQEEVENAL
ncbi:MAG: hypothetical protein U9P71_04775 [Campylobacterota bacterium]|nr:hypothetical protein [Campylobacterota bacterium]